jgi:hypothetical protein
MRWTEEGLSSVIALRTHALNDCYDTAVTELPEVA